MKKRLLILACFSLLINICNATIHYVKQGATGSGNSWQQASGDLQLQINNANPQDTIWIAKGTFYPIRAIDNLMAIDSGNRKNSFVIKNGLKFFGGFDNVGTPTLEDRNFSLFPTVLSGDIGNSNDTSDNCYHVIVCVRDSSEIFMDGFEIKGGNARSAGLTTIGNTSINNFDGGGIYLYCSIPSFSNLIVDSNYASNGGGVYSFQASANFTKSFFLGNVAIVGYGGAIENFQECYPIYDHVKFTNNYSGYLGGAIHTSFQSYIRATNTEFTHNIAAGNGGAVYTDYAYSYSVFDKALFKDNKAQNGGGIYISDTRGIILTNTIFIGNSATSSGGGAIYEPSLYQPIFAINCTFYQNSGTECGGIFFADAYDSKIENCLFWQNNATATGYESNGDIYRYNVNPTQLIFSCLLSPYSTSLIGINNNITGEPMFRDTLNRDVRLSCGSVAIDAGKDSFYQSNQMPDFSDIHTDFVGNSRFSKSAVDIGAYEYIFEGDTVKASICNGESYVHNGVPYSSSFVGYLDTFVNAEGCDSFIVLDLTVNNIDTVVNISNNILTANQSNASYQWIDCTSGEEVSGATNQNFEASTYGSYKVMITMDGCSDTSGCYEINVTGINEIKDQLAFNISPNPSSEILRLKCLKPIEIKNISIADVIGKRSFPVIVKLQQPKQTDIDIHSFNNGVYILKVITKDGYRWSFKFIKG